MSIPFSIIARSVKKMAGSFQERAPGFSRKAALAEARRCPQCSHPACVAACPLGVDIPLFIRHLREGDAAAAFRKIKESNPFPGVCGQVCPAPCEKHCILSQEGDAIAIRKLERFAYDQGRRKTVKPVSPGKNAVKTAIVGAGPCGLTAASVLAGQGFPVTIFESLPFAGGVLRYAVPGFRLSKDVLNQEIADLEARGVTLRTHTPIGKMGTVAELFKQGFGAVLLAVGSGSPGPADRPGLYLEGVYFAQEILIPGNFVRQDVFRKAMGKKLRQKVVVLGATARGLDVARVCARLGKDVTVIFAGTEDELDFHPEDKSQARREGVVLKALTQPLDVLGAESRRVRGVTCRMMDYGDPDGTGRWQLMPVPDSDTVIEAGTVVFAEDPAIWDLFLKPFPGIRLRECGLVRVDGDGMTDVPGLFAAGAAVAGNIDLVRAMAAGKTAALRIEKYFQESGSSCQRK